MSFEIVAFDPGQTTDEDFDDWFAGEAEWQDGSTDPSILDSAGLQAFYAELTDVYPPREGPKAPTGDELVADHSLEAMMTDYSLSHYLIVAGFRYSEQDHATSVMTRLGATHHVAIAILSEAPAVIIRPELP
jgi:hypothetical protein